jgi:AcrR family transcriptional regulator
MGPDLDTRQRLLDTATKLFAQQGFSNVTIRDVCDAAKANVASVNYHFRNKHGLYLAVIELAVQAMRQLDREARQAGEGLPARARLRSYIRVFLERRAAMGADSWIHQLIKREFSDPTDALDVLIEKAIRPRFEYLGSLVAELLRCDPEDRRVMKCIISIQSQFLMLAPSASMSSVYSKVGVKPPSLDEIAEHIADFSLAGIRALADRRPNRVGRATRSSQIGSAIPQGRRKQSV